MRQPKPYFRQQKQAWYVQIDGRQFSLGRDEKKAWQRYHELILNRADLDSETVTAAQLIDTFLEWCSKHRSKGTFENSRRYCRHFINSAGKKLTVAKIKPKHITEWIDRHPGWTNTSKNDAISAVQRAMNWATKQGGIFLGHQLLGTMKSLLGSVAKSYFRKRSLKNLWCFHRYSLP